MKRNIMKTYYYDYHTLQKSIESNKILKECYVFELDIELTIDNPNKENINGIKAKIKSRDKIINYQESKLQEMEKVIESFPEHLKKTEDRIFRLKIIKNLPDDIIAIKLGYCEQHVRKITSDMLNKFIEYQKTMELI